MCYYKCKHTDTQTRTLLDTLVCQYTYRCTHPQNTFIASTLEGANAFISARMQTHSYSVNAHALPHIHTLPHTPPHSAMLCIRLDSNGEH